TGDTRAYPPNDDAGTRNLRCPPEDYWPYSLSDFEREPPAFCLAFAQNYQAEKYLRLDEPSTDRSELLDRIEDEHCGGSPFDVRLHRVQLDLAGGRDGENSVSDSR
ncbi:MAG: hypothetical protein M3292_02435, partial [Actinomycetota bacterium]|nr:hypothetical protein [Actinomycetota bacterium]